MKNEPLPDADWMAYVDGDLDAPGRQRVEAAMAADATLAARVRAQQQLRERLQRGLAAELDEPLPDRFTALLAPAAQPVLAGAGQLAAGGGQGQRWVLLFGAGLLAGLLLLRPWSGSDDDLRLQGPLAQALEQRLGSEATSEGYRLALSFRNRAGEFCRGFSGQGQAGLACKQGDAWRLQMLVPAVAAESEMRQAGSALPAAVLEAVDAQLQGQTLDAAAEREARARGWR